MTDASPLTFGDASRGFADGSDSPRAYLERCLETIERREPVVKAFTTLDIQGARIAADEAAHRYRSGRQLSPLDGMPVGLKDLFETRGELTEANSRVHAGWRPMRDSACVIGIRQLGAYVLGKTTTSELGAGVAPATTNPRDETRTPGGSSSGSAAAVAAGMVPAAIGTQVMGSVVRPASFCGVIGFKPSFGAIHRGGGVGPPGSVATIGILANDLGDAWMLARLLSAVTGPDPGWRPLGGELAIADREGSPRIGILRPAGWDELPSAVRTAFDDFIEKIGSSGVTIIDPDDDAVLGRFQAASAEAGRIHAQICRFEGRWPLRQYQEAGLLSDKLGRTVTSEDWMNAEDYSRTLDFRDEYRKIFDVCFDRVDSFITLTVNGPAPLGLANMGATAFQVPASLLGAPAISLPLLQCEGMPLGVQLIGRIGNDARLMVTGRLFSA